MRGSDGNRTPIVDVHEMCITFTLDLIEFNSLLLNKMFFSVALNVIAFLPHRNPMFVCVRFCLHVCCRSVRHAQAHWCAPVRVSKYR